jgi:hypothetical protein
MRKTPTFLALSLVALALAGCGGPSSSGSTTPLSSTEEASSSNDGEGVAAKGVKHTLEETRSKAYQTHLPDGTAKEQFVSLYQAIDAVVTDTDNYDFESYITKIGDTEKLFINKEKYSDTSADLFWQYKDNSTLDGFSPWQTTYWTDYQNTTNTVVYISPTQGPLPYYQGWRMAGVNSDANLGAGNTAVWNCQSTVEAESIVNMLAFSGITKETYKVKLTDAKFAPALGDSVPTSAFVGFIETDSYNVSNLGIECDTTTGDWYFYSGERDMNSDKTVIEDKKCLLTSTWDDTTKSFTPDEDVTMTMETLTLKDNDGEDYLVDRLTLEFSSGRKAVRDYEFAKITQCGTIRFASGLDVKSSDGHQMDFMNGSYFKNVTVTEATAYALPEMQDSDKYGNVAQLDPGTYDILNSNPETAARFQTIVYGACSSYDFATPGKDVYSYSFSANSDNPAINPSITNAIDLIAALPEAAAVSVADTVKINKARKAYDALSKVEKLLVSNYQRLVDAENALASL